MWDQSLTELFQRGGPVMWPLLAASIFGLALILDRTLAFLRRLQSFRRLVRRLERPVRMGNLLKAAETCRGGGPYSRFASHFLQWAHEAPAVRDNILEREGAVIVEEYEERLRALSAVAQISILLGLLGTVTGLVEAFHQVQLQGGQVQASDLASGIWEAMITTVAGLIIAVPCLVAYHFFDARADAVARRLSRLASLMEEWHREGRHRLSDAGESTVLQESRHR